MKTLTAIWITIVITTITIIGLYFLVSSKVPETYRGAKAISIYSRQSGCDAIEYKRKDGTDRFITIDRYNRVKYECFMPSKYLKSSDNMDRQSHTESIVLKVTRNIDVDEELYQCMIINAVDWRKLKKE